MTVIGDKTNGVLGEAELNLSLYSEDEPASYKIPLKKCVDPDAYLDLTLFAVPIPDKTINTPKSNGAGHEKSE